ncbi:hypothetical protein [Leucothrix arctica]|uniref:hypothetical protein n=1 Tax=Leucothrix arctica TaxID=1481894 RepID=UPI001304CF3F|nr:hypothetical protein [Leucothrix arctica]
MELSVKQTLESYPDSISILLKHIREQILASAEEAGISNVEETLYNYGASLP